MRQIVCLSHTHWSSCPTRTQQLMSRLSGAQVLFFEPPGRKPEPNGRKVRPNVTVYQLPKMVDLFSHTKPVARYNRRRIASCVEKAMKHHRFREPLLWCTTPENVHQLDRLAYRGLVYDCHHYWSNLPIQWEGDLAALADVCFVASDGLMDRLAPCNENLALLPNGVNFPLFRRESVEAPSDAADLVGKPVIGFVGTLHADLDLSPLIQCADAHPEWTFLLIGPVIRSPYLAHLEARDNIRLLGKRPLVDIPDYLSVCTACVDLLRRQDEDSDVIHYRIYEYMAAGKPIAAMVWKHQRQEYPDVVHAARTTEEFIRQCEAAMAEDPEELLRRRRDYGAAAAWDERAERIRQILEFNGLY